MGTPGNFQPEGLTEISPGQARLRAPPRVLIKKIEDCPERARETSPSKNRMKTAVNVKHQTNVEETGFRSGEWGQWIGIIVWDEV